MSVSHLQCLWPLGTVVVVLGALAYACASQSEGQPCISAVDNNGNDNQCASPLQCVTPPNCSQAACCAQSADGGVTSTVAACQGCPAPDSGADAASDGPDGGATGSSDSGVGAKDTGAVDVADAGASDTVTHP